MYTVKGTRFRVLSKQELRKILMVPCTKKQARQLIRRSQIPLNHIAEGKKFGEIWELPCPHCNCDMDCDWCDWQYYPDFDPEDPKTHACTQVTFGGVAYDPTSHWVPCASKCIELTDNSISWEPSEATVEDISNAIRFLKGHVEWGKAVLAGIKPTDVRWRK